MVGSRFNRVCKKPTRKEEQSRPEERESEQLYPTLQVGCRQLSKYNGYSISKHMSSYDPDQYE
jgi:hypothetical protein